MDARTCIYSEAREFAPNERIDLSLLLRGAEVSAYLSEELATAGADLS